VNKPKPLSAERLEDIKAHTKKGYQDYWSPELLSHIAYQASRISELEAGLNFYANPAHWTTNDDELHFIKVTDEDWDRRTGGACGGGVARKLLSPKDTQEEVISE